MRRRRGACVALVLSTTLTACKAESGSTQADHPTTTSADPTPALLVEPVRSVFEARAAFQGRITLTSAGCFGLDRMAIIAPFGSKVVDATSFSVPGLGTFTVGQKLRTSGGVAAWPTLASVPQEYRGCVPPDAHRVVFAGLNFDQPLSGRAD